MKETSLISAVFVSLAIQIFSVLFLYVPLGLMELKVGRYEFLSYVGSFLLCSGIIIGILGAIYDDSDN